MGSGCRRPKCKLRRGRPPRQGLEDGCHGSDACCPASLPCSLSDVEDRSGETLPSDDFDHPPRLGNSAAAPLEQEQDPIGRGEHCDGDGISDRRVQRHDESWLGGHLTACGLDQLHGLVGALQVELHAVDELDRVSPQLGSQLGEAMGKAQRLRRPLGRDHGQTGPGTQQQQPVPQLVDVISVGDGHTSQGKGGFPWAQAVLAQTRPFPEAVFDGHRVRVPIPTRDAGFPEARKQGRSQPSTRQLRATTSRISPSRGTFSARSTCQFSSNLRERKSTKAVDKSARASPAIRLAPSTSLGLGLIGPRGFCTGTRTVYRYLNAARAESSSRRAPSIRSRKELYLVSAKLTCSLKYPICGSSSSRGSNAPRCSAWITTAVGCPTSRAGWSERPRF